MKTKRRGRGWIWGLLILAAMVGAGVMFADRWGKSTVIPPERIVKVERGDIARSVVALGRIEPHSKVELKSKANGIIEALLVDVGDAVTEGQILAELDKDALKAQVREARATRDAVVAGLEVATAAEKRARIEAANPELDFARRDLQRVLALSRQGIASASELDGAQQAHDLAENRRQLLLAAADSATARVSELKAQVQAATAALDRAEENLRYATIRSPISGIVLARDREVGDAVSSILNLGSAATLIMMLGDMSSVYVKGEVDEADVGRIKAGDPVRTTVESFAGETFCGEVTRIAPIGRERDNVTTFEVRVSIANPQGKLRANMSANAEIVLEERQDVLLVPEAALFYDHEGKPSVHRRAPEAKVGYETVAVETGISNGQRTEVLSGVAAGEELVLP